ncbi:related to YSC84 - protein involved in the organization of the actin cytoskeleton [Melanopsichium pennsylvanicum]|uniref:Related to YSC84 - protein involved in the organization of the actin cytoskeleton n=2 Tax=Melanopsichium pennsylvanicum TaxID=63383 RepID=A0AAJ4XKY7_9BASI|nr:related to YSC84-protein involved in the organization of the actin cytoskeleton [Melanopsichium pennsylvanicum 4]SNX84055.1 related to YSC84 - protein involved in the organization of the actin cytoskeleton [Melanopsichium pennsylvanicum]
MPIDLKKALKTDDPKWDKFKQGYKKVETGAWNVLAPVGNWTNRTAGKFGAESFWPTELSLECDKAARILRTFTTKGASVDVDANNADGINDQNAVITPAAPKVDANGKKIKDPHKYDHRKTQKVIRKIPPKVLQKAHGLAIFTVFRTGFGFSGASGSGVVLSRLPDGSWSAPSGLLVHTLGYGLLIGLDIYDVVLVLRNQKAVEAFKHPKLSLGGELSVACGPVGNGAMLDSGVEAAPCWSYVKSKGFYAGLQLDGNIILKRDDENGRFYKSPGIKVDQILSGQLQGPAPAAIMPLWQTIYAAEGRPDVMGTDRIPEGATPGDLELTEADMKEASNYAEQEKQQQHQQHHSAVTAPVGSISSRKLPPPPPSAAVGGSTVVGSSEAPPSQPYADLPPDYEFANAPVTAQGGKQFNDPVSSSQPYQARSDDLPDPFSHPADAPTVALQYESAEAEKARLQQQYAPESSVTTTPSTYSSLPSQVEALYDFAGQEQEDLPFRVGDVIQVTGQEDESWWRGSLNGRLGIFPSNYVRSL